MTQELQRIKLAEALGYRRHPHFTRGWLMPGKQTGEPGSYTPHLPDFSENLNAIATAEKNLLLNDPKLRRRYVHELRCMDRPRPDFFLLTASASERLEAMLRTLNLWPA